MFVRSLSLVREEVGRLLLPGILLIAILSSSAGEQDINDAASAKNGAVSDSSFADSEGKRALQYSFGLGKKSAEESLPEEQLLLEELNQVDPDIKRNVMNQMEPARFGFGLGKRADDRNRYGFGLGKRGPGDRFNFGLGKRGEERNRFGFGLGKRGEDYNRFAFGLGKRPDDFNRFGFGLGKRGEEVNRFSFGLGKRPDERNRFGFGLGKRPDERNRFGFGLGKRGEDYNRFAFGLGKRGDEYNRFAFGLGKRRDEDNLMDYGLYDLDFPEQIDSGLDKRRDHYFKDQQEDFTKRRYNFGLGKRSIPEESVSQAQEEKSTQ